MAQGMSNREIAEKLFVSENTVKTHSSHLFDKLSAKRRTQAVQIAKEMGLIPKLTNPKVVFSTETPEIIRKYDDNFTPQQLAYAADFHRLLRRFCHEENRFDVRLDFGWDLCGDDGDDDAVSRSDWFRKRRIIGYTTLVVAFVFVFFGIRSYRENVGNGYITFGRAFKVGILITLIACLCYVISWQIVYYGFVPDFGEKYTST